MAKKRTVKKAARKRSAKRTAKTTAAESSVKKNAGKLSRKKTAGKTRTKKKTAGTTRTKKKTATQRARRKKTGRPMPLGRPGVTLDSKLDELFLKDYEVRQVFEFLNVSTLRELEVYGPDEIVEKLTAPMVQAVGRIRKVLALKKRCLKGDTKFAEKFHQQMQQHLKDRGRQS